MVGDEASQLRAMLEVNYPMENGIVRNWDDMLHLYDYTFGENKLNIDPRNCKLLLTEPPMNPMKNRQKMVEVWEHFFSCQYLSIIQVMFEHYQFEGLYVAIQAVLTLYAQGYLTHSTSLFLKVILRSFNRRRFGLRRRSDPHLSSLRRLCFTAFNPKTWHCWQGYHALFNKGTYFNAFLYQNFEPKHFSFCFYVDTPSTIRPTSKRSAWWRRNSATSDTTLNRNRNLPWKLQSSWNRTRYASTLLEPPCCDDVIAASGRPRHQGWWRALWGAGSPFSAAPDQRRWRWRRWAAL